MNLRTSSNGVVSAEKKKKKEKKKKGYQKYTSYQFHYDIIHQIRSREHEINGTEKIDVPVLLLFTKVNSNGKDREQNNSEQVGQDHTCELYECKIIINHSILSTTHIY